MDRSRENLLTWLRPRERADVVLGAAFAAASLAQVLIAPIAGTLTGVAIALASTLPLMWRRTFPAAAAVAGSAVWVVPSEGFVVLGYVAALLLFYSAGAHVASNRRLAAATIAGLALGGVAALTHESEWVDLINTATVVIAPVAVGRFVRHERQQRAQLRDLTIHLERERERTAELAVADERARIARELHDIVAHGITVIAIQADAAEAVLEGSGSPALAPVEEIKRTARDSMREMRGLLGVLRDEESGSDRAPLPGLEQLPALIDRTRDAGIDVTFSVEGEPRLLPQSVDLAAYRIVQESLTNIRKHAGSAPASVTLRWGEADLEVIVRDQGPGTENDGGASGHGLIGMAERVRVHGGTLRTGNAVGGGFEVRAVLTGEEDTA